MTSSRAAALRALAITAVLVIHGLFALPVPDVLTERDLAAPDAREETARWRDGLSAIGVDVDAETFDRWLLTWSARIAGPFRAIKRRLRPALTLTGTGQGWPLFAVPLTTPSHFEVLAVTPTGRVRMYRTLDADHAWRAPQLRHRRVRGLWDAERAGPGYEGLTRWIAAGVLADRADATAVIVRLLRVHTTLPGAPADPAETPHRGRRVTRDELAP